MKGCRLVASSLQDAAPASSGVVNRRPPDLTQGARVAAEKPALCPLRIDARTPEFHVTLMGPASTSKDFTFREHSRHSLDCGVGALD